MLKSIRPIKTCTHHVHDWNHEVSKQSQASDDQLKKRIEANSHYMGFPVMDYVMVLGLNGFPYEAIRQLQAYYAGMLKVLTWVGPNAYDDFSFDCESISPFNIKDLVT